MRNAALAFAAGTLLALGALGPLAVRAGSSDAPGSFQALMDAAMARMHAGMEIVPSGDPDRDFARMMIPHHQGAIDMAVLELTYGKDERLRRLAQGIIVEQRQEIVLMERALASPDGGRDAGPAR